MGIREVPNGTLGTDDAVGSTVLRIPSSGIALRAHLGGFSSRRDTVATCTPTGRLRSSPRWTTPVAQIRAAYTGFLCGFLPAVLYLLRQLRRRNFFEPSSAGWARCGRPPACGEMERPGNCGPRRQRLLTWPREWTP